MSVQPMKVITGSAVSAMTAVVLFSSSVSAAAPSCDASSFNVNGEFDTDGYLACLANLADPSGGLPPTGSNTTQFVALGAAAVAMGVAARFAAVRRRNVTA